MMGGIDGMVAAPLSHHVKTILGVTRARPLQIDILSQPLLMFTHSERMSEFFATSRKP
jgi:hypothetical protein